MTREGEGTRRRQGCGRQEGGRINAKALQKAAARAAAQIGWVMAGGMIWHEQRPDAVNASAASPSSKGWAMGRRLAAVVAEQRALPAAQPVRQESEGYDEFGMVAHTVLRYHPHLLTEQEQRVLDGFEARWKIAVAPDPDAVRQIVETSGDPHGHGVGALLDRGYDAFCRELAERVLHEQPAGLVLNRCPRCTRIVRTPKAQQCLWCFHDWH